MLVVRVAPSFCLAGAFRFSVGVLSKGAKCKTCSSCLSGLLTVCSLAPILPPLAYQPWLCSCAQAAIGLPYCPWIYPMPQEIWACGLELPPLSDGQPACGILLYGRACGTPYANIEAFGGSSPDLRVSANCDQPDSRFHKFSQSDQFVPEDQLGMSCLARDWFWLGVPPPAPADAAAAAAAACALAAAMAACRAAFAAV